jgi:hypothetical protein
MSHKEQYGLKYQADGERMNRVGEYIVIPKSQWKAHKRYVRRLRRKERQKAEDLKRAQEELRTVGWCVRQISKAFHIMSRVP